MENVLEKIFIQEIQKKEVQKVHTKEVQKVQKVHSDNIFNKIKQNQCTSQCTSNGSRGSLRGSLSEKKDVFFDIDHKPTCLDGRICRYSRMEPDIELQGNILWCSFDKNGKNGRAVFDYYYSDDARCPLNRWWK